MLLETESVESLDESREQCTDGSPFRRASDVDRADCSVTEGSNPARMRAATPRGLFGVFAVKLKRCLQLHTTRGVS